MTYNWTDQKKQRDLIAKIRNEREDITTNLTEIKQITIGVLQTNIMSTKLDSLDEIDNFLKNTNC